jgi:hypothetical protein
LQTLAKENLLPREEQRPAAVPKRFTESDTRAEVAFEQDVIDAMSRAFDAVCERLTIPETADAPREMIAMRIVELASKGERDAERLRDEALKSIGGMTGVP